MGMSPGGHMSAPNWPSVPTFRCAADDPGVQDLNAAPAALNTIEWDISSLNTYEADQARYIGLTGGTTWRFNVACLIKVTCTIKAQSTIPDYEGHLVPQPGVPSSLLGAYSQYRPLGSIQFQFVDTWQVTPLDTVEFAVSNLSPGPPAGPVVLDQGAILFELLQVYT